MKKIITLLALVLFFAACSSDDDKQDILPQIVVNTDEVHLKIGELNFITIKIVNAGGIVHKLDAYAENDGIAIMDTTGLVRGIGPGETYGVIKYGEIEKRIKIKVSNEYDLEAYYDEYCYGFRVKDTTDLRVISYSPEKDEDMPYLYGERNGKLWIGKFNKQSREQITEYLTNKPVSFQRQIYTGYGEYLDVTINKIEQVCIYETKNGWVSELIFGDRYKAETWDYRLLLFNEANDTKEYYFYAPIYPIEKWYEDSFIKRRVGVEDYNCTIYKANGEVISNGKLPDRNYIPISYDNYISLSHSHTQFNYDEITYLGIEIKIASLSNTDSPVEKTFIYNRLSKETNSILTYEVMNVVNNVYTIRVDITYYSGDKVMYFYEVDAPNGLIKQKDVIIL